MGPFDPQEAELFDALAWIEEQDDSSMWAAFRADVGLAAW